jgi:hypothetical protein
MVKDIHPDDAVLNEYLDGVLDAVQGAALEAHLEGCAGCRLRLVELRAVFLALEGLAEARLERDLAPDVLAALASRSQGRAVMIPPVLKLGFVAQFLLAAGLSMAAWPLIARRLPVGRLTWLGQSMLSQLKIWSQQATIEGSSLLEAVSAQWESFLRLAQDFVRQGLDAWSHLPVHGLGLQIPWLELVILLVVAGLFWLAANGLLLRPPRLDNLPPIFSDKRRSS